MTNRAKVNVSLTTDNNKIVFKQAKKKKQFNKKQCTIQIEDQSVQEINTL